MFNGAFFESASQTGVFPEESPDAFALLLEWFYGNKLCALSCQYAQPGVYSPVEALIRLYALADMLLLPQLQDCAVSTLMGYCKIRDVGPSFQEIDLVYELTSTGCGLRRLMVEWVVGMVKIQPGDSGEVERSMRVCEVASLMEGNGELIIDVLMARDKVKEEGKSGSNTVVSSSGPDGGLPGAVSERVKPYDLPKCRFHVHGDGQECFYS